MSYLNEFNIPFGGLAIGKHQYHFSIDARFFEEIEYSEIKKGELKVDLLLNKQESMLVLEFYLEGKVNVECDRCLELFYIPVSGRQQLIVKFGKEQYEETDEIVVLRMEESEMNISHYIYEYINLILPYRRIHKDLNLCNQETVKKLEEIMVKEKKSIQDPRWNALSNLKKK